MSETRDLWFESEGTTPFLERVRTLAAASLAPLVPPDATTGMPDFIGGCLLSVEVPDIPSGERPVINQHIQVLRESRGLGGYWGCAHLWDEYDEQDAEALVVRGVELTEDQAAQFAVGWLVRQLSRPLDLHVWKRGERIVTRRWVLADTGRVVGYRGRRAPRRRPPTEIVRLRGGSTNEKGPR